MPLRQFTTFRVNDHLLGLDVLLVREINRTESITPLQLEPPYIRGLINLRGQIVTIIDLSARLGGEPNKTAEKKHNVILRNRSELAPILKRGAINALSAVDDSFGILVDEVCDVVEVEDKDLEGAPANIDGMDERFIAGIAQLDDGLLIILNTTELLNFG